MKGKPRGSVSGLIKNRADVQASNTQAMLDVLAQLREKKPFKKWTYKEVWSGAGLKSQVPLNSNWNTHIRNEIDNHNKLVSLAQGTSFCKNDKNQEAKIDSLQSLLRQYKSERDNALTNIATFSAETEYFKKKCQDLQEIIKRLKTSKQNT